MAIYRRGGGLSVWDLAGRKKQKGRGKKEGKGKWTYLARNHQVPHIRRVTKALIDRGDKMHVRRYDNGRIHPSLLLLHLVLLP